MSKTIDTGISADQLLAEVMRELDVDKAVELDPAIHLTYETLERETGHCYGWLKARMGELVQRGAYRKISVILPNGKRGVAFVKGSAK